jgi:uncharacterized protein (TIGR00255 family)
MRSMTGFGVGESSIGGPVAAGASSVSVSPPSKGTGKVTIEIRAVNHRFLDVRVRGPSQLPDLASVVESFARERLNRGRFDITIRVDASLLGAMTVDLDRARSVFTALEQLRDELAPKADVPLSLLGAVPDLFVPVIEREGDSLHGGLSAAFDHALKSLDSMRLREGLSLGEDLTRRLATIRRLMQALTTRAPFVIETYKKKLKERAERLRMASDVEVDSGRLEQEIALFADRTDVAEELTRLESHSTHFQSLLESKEAVGRRLDFLLQEMAREANTIGSKSQDVTIAHAIVELKAEIERMREQVQNVE